MGKKVKKVVSKVSGGLVGGTDDASKALARQQEQQAQMARDAQADLRNVDQLNVAEGAAAEAASGYDDDEALRRRKPRQGLSEALGLGGL